MTREQEGDLLKEFERLQKAVPALADGAKIISRGNYGLVIQYDDKTLRKVLMREPTYHHYERYLRLFYGEIGAMSYLEKHPVDGLEIPVLIGETDHLYQQDYIATYQMSFLEGSHPSRVLEEDPSMRPEPLYESIGILLGRFHKAAAGMRMKIPPTGPEQSRIVTVAGFPDRLNLALAEADSYLHTNKISGVVHGDFHNNNILVRDSIATGLIDFSFTGYTDNIFMDHRFIHSEFRESFKRGYEFESGTKIPQFMDAALSLASAVDTINMDREFHSATPETEKDGFEHIYEILNYMVPVTGIKP